MVETFAPIGRVKRDISDLINRVAYGGERIILTSRDKPKAVLVSMDDYEHLKRIEAGERQAQWQSWLAQADALVEDVLRRRGGEPIPVDELMASDREEREAQSERILGCR